MHSQRYTTPSGAKTGYSLIEVLIALTIVAAGLVGCSGALVYAAKISTIAQDSITAETIASEVLTATRNAPFDDVQSWYTHVAETGTTGLEWSCRNKLATADLADARVWCTVTDIRSDLKGVSVTITWSAGDPGGKVETETLISPQF